MRRYRAHAVVAALMVLSIGCEDRTYVNVTVEAAPGLEDEVVRLEFTTRLMRGDDELSSDQRRFPEKSSSQPLSFPNAFVIVADERGRDGEVVEIEVVGYDADDAVVARARGDTPVVPNKASALRIILGRPCSTVSDCRTGGAFCDAPVRCNCEAEDCQAGFCEPSPVDDDNPCTVGECNEDSEVVVQNALEDGTSCRTSAGDQLSCSSGVCTCGDGVVQDNEDCDDGMMNGSGMSLCRVDCTIIACGDGILDSGPPLMEACDDGADNANLPDTCRTDCSLPSCGDNIEDQGEECDEGAENSDTLANRCRTSCAAPSCGDGVIDDDPGDFLRFLEDEDFYDPLASIDYRENCDDGASNSASADGGCRPSVTLVGNSSEGIDGVTVLCRRAFCGDGVVDSVEKCDDGNTLNQDGCNATCSLTGSVTQIFGASGGPGATDGIGTEASVRPIHSFAVVGDDAYFTTDGGGGDHAIRRVDVTTAEVTTVAGSDQQFGATDDTGTAARFDSPRGIDSDGTYLYIADRGNHVIRRMNLSTGAVETIAGTAGTPGSTDGDGSTATFTSPTFVAVNSATEIFVYDAGDPLAFPAPPGCLLRRLTLSGGTVTVSTVAGGDSNGCLVADDTAGSFGEVTDIEMGEDGLLYIHDSGTLRTFDPSSSDATPSYATVSSSAGFGRLSAATDTIYFADSSAGEVKSYSISGSTVTTQGSLVDVVAVAVAGTRLLLGNSDPVIYIEKIDADPFSPEPLAGSIETAGFSSEPQAAALWRQGSSARVFVGLRLDASVRTFDFSGYPATLDDQGALPAVTGSSLNFTAMQVASDGSTPRLWVAGDDGSADYIWRLDPSTGAEGSPILNEDLSPILGLAVDGAQLFFTQYIDGVLRSAPLSTMVSELWAGQPGLEATGDGSVDEAVFETPTGITKCGDSLWVAESGAATDNLRNTHLIRRIQIDPPPASYPEGLVTTIAGSHGISGSEGGFGFDARFDSPQSIACDPPRSADGYPGSLYIGDRGGNLIRQIRLDTLEVSTLVGQYKVEGTESGSSTESTLAQPLGLVYDSGPDPTSAHDDRLYFVDFGGNSLRAVD